MKITTTILILLVFMQQSLLAQDRNRKSLSLDIAEGYIVTNNLDTLLGQVSVATQKNNIRFISFHDSLGKKNIFTANDIIAFGQQKQPGSYKQVNFIKTNRDWIHYASIEHPRKFGQKVFMERLINGQRISLYNDVLQLEPATSLVGLKREETDESYIVHKQGMKPFVLRSRSFKHDAKVLFSDCTEFVVFMQQHSDKFRFKNIDFIIESYNRLCH